MSVSNQVFYFENDPALRQADIDAQKGAANGLASLDASGRLNYAQIPAGLTSGLDYQGTFDPVTNLVNGATTLADGGLLGGVQQVAGTFVIIRASGAFSASVDGITTGTAGAKLVSNGAVWEYLDDPEVITTEQIENLAVTTGKIALLAVTAAQIDNATITGAKIAAGTVTSGNIQDGTITGTDIAGLTITGANIANTTIAGAKLQNNTITAGQIAAATITSAEIAAGTITGGVGGNIATGTITTLNILDGTITGTDIASGTVTGTNIASTTITDANIATATITGAKIAGTTITAANIANGTITTTQIADGTITGADIAATTITGGNLVNQTITATQIAPTTITSAELADNSVTTNKITNLNVTRAKLETVTTTSELTAPYPSASFVLFTNGAGNESLAAAYDTSDGTTPQMTYIATKTTGTGVSIYKIYVQWRIPATLVAWTGNHIEIRYKTSSTSTATSSLAAEVYAGSSSASTVGTLAEVASSTGGQWATATITFGSPGTLVRPTQKYISLQLALKVNTTNSTVSVGNITFNYTEKVGL